MSANANERSVPRRRLLRGLLGMGAASAAGVAAARPAGAADGDPLLLGETNNASSGTRLVTADDTFPSEIHFGSENLAAITVVSSTTQGGVLATTGEGGLAGIQGQALGTTGSGVAGWADMPGAMGVVGLTQGGGPAIAGQSDVDGVTLLLVPAERTGPPAAMPPGLTTYAQGSISVDETGDLWLCVASGAPGSWTRLLREDTAPGRTVPITSFRALDTRATGGRASGSPAVPGQVQGPLHGGQVVTLDLAGVDAIPPSATGVIGNLTAVTPGYTGYVRATPAGQPFNTTALSFIKGPNLGNAFTVRLGPGGVSFRPSGTAANTLHLVVDVTAYIT